MVTFLQRVREKHAGLFFHIDWVLLITAVSISLMGLVTMRSFSAENVFFEKQMVWICMAIVVFFIASIPRYDFLRHTAVVAGMYVLVIAMLGALLLFGRVVMGAQTRFDLGFFGIQPTDPAKLILVALLAKYFTRRHIEIRHIKHILVSGVYAFVLFIFVFLQPDLGSGIIIFSIWFGMVLVAGMSWKHLGALLITGLIVIAGLWTFALQPYQKQRVLTFIHPLTDIRGSGYNAYQAMVAVGSGEVTGKGIGYGTQSKLQFLPEFQTDFIFAAYAEEWGFLGLLLLFGLYTILILRILSIAAHGDTTYEMLFGAGIALYFIAQFVVHGGMNIGLMPITGATIPFMSYGGSHLLTEFLALGILCGMRKHARSTVQARDETELIGAI